MGPTSVVNGNRCGRCCFTARQFPAGRSDAGRIQPKVGKQLAAITMFDKAIGDSQSDDRTSSQTRIVGRFEDGSTEASLEGVFFNGYHPGSGLNPIEQDLRGEWLDKPSIDQANIKPFFTEVVSGLHARPDQASAADDQAVPSLKQ